MAKRHVLIGVTALALSITASAAAHHYPPPVVPPVETAQVSRAGYCDQFEVFWNLEVGQKVTGLVLRPANVGLLGNPFAIWC